VEDVVVKQGFVTRHELILAQCKLLLNCSVEELNMFLLIRSCDIILYITSVLPLPVSHMVELEEEASEPSPAGFLKALLFVVLPL
jgi:hypothetical protein